MGKLGMNLGITIATDKKIHQTSILNLGTRKALSVILDVGSHGLQLAGYYADHLSEENRLSQMHALVDKLDANIPTVITGDFNTLRPSLRKSTIGRLAGDMAVRAAAHVLPAGHPVGQSVRGMNERRCIPYLESRGYVDADRGQKRPTFPAKLPVFGLDYVFANTFVSIDNLAVVPVNGASDHRALAYTAVVS